MNGTINTPTPHNEPVLGYAPGSPETEELQGALGKFLAQTTEIPIRINGERITTGVTQDVILPHNHGHVAATLHKARPADVQSAIEGAKTAWKDWSRTSLADRQGVFLKVAELIAGKYRSALNATTMLGQSKTCHQAEIDAACELIDFLRFNCHYQSQVYEMQPNSPKGIWNRLEYRPLEGFVFAVTPFNFTAIAANLPTSVALMGNVVLWKPARTQTLAAHVFMDILEEAGLPPGVIQFLPGDGADVGDHVLKHPDLAGIHFTGSTNTFQMMWRTVGENIDTYRTYPRVVGETGGKDFIFAHPSADLDALCANTIRGAFEYQGQKCSAASRLYVPKSLWPKMKERLVEEVATIKMGDPADFSNFMAAVIDRRSFDKISGYISESKQASGCTTVTGGNFSDEVGFFIEPTTFEVTDPHFRTMREEIFGPVLTVYPYEDSKMEETLELCNTTSPYALTGAVFAQDRRAIRKISDTLSHAAGNFYVNVKPTGAVVGQQPFGGSRASGTNDKAGSLFNLLRWTSLRTISETFEPPVNYRYPFLG